MKKKKSQHTISVSQIKQLRDNLFFHIDNPDYKRKNVH